MLSEGILRYLVGIIRIISRRGRYWSRLILQTNYFKYMKKNLTAIVIIILVVIIGVWVIVSSRKHNNYNLGLNNNSKVTTNGNVSTTKQLFSSSSLSKNAFLISTPTYDANTKTALIGFNVTQKPLTDGSNEITLSSQNKEYKTQVYTVKPGEKLYFIESFLQDDSGNTDRNLRDDTAVLVDADGYIIN